MIEKAKIYRFGFLTGFHAWRMDNISAPLHRIHHSTNDDKSVVKSHLTCNKAINRMHRTIQRHMLE